MGGMISAVGKIVAWARTHWWDLSHAVSTCGNQAPSTGNVTESAKGAVQHAILYMPTHPKLVHRIFKILDLEPGRYDFIDFGSGKGRVLLIASQYPLRQVTGVEFDSRLNEIACANIRTFRGARRCEMVRSVCLDAQTYDLPARDTVFFFFFPFRKPVMEVVLERIRQSLENHPRDGFLVYVNPELGYLVDAAGAFTPFHTDQYCRIWRVRC